MERTAVEGTIPVTINRLPLTLPCPVPVVPGTTGSTLGLDGEPIPLEERTELCAVDAGWMIGAQIVCDVHLREAWDVGGIGPGTFEDAVAETFAPYGADAVEEALARSRVPWLDRKRYPQEEARRHAEV